MRLGIGSYTYAWAVGVPGYPAPSRPLTVSALLEKAAELGVRVVQIADNLPIDCLTDADRDSLVRQATRLRIDLEVGTRGIHPDHLYRYVRIATELRSPILRVVVDTVDHKPTPDEIVAILRPMMPEFERARVTLALENHDRFRAAVLANILDRIDSAFAGICLDTANSIGCLENVDTLLATLGPRVVNLHVKDYCVFRPPHNKGFVVEGRPAGQGQLDVPALLAATRAYGRNPNVIVELWPPPEPTVEASVFKEEEWAQTSVCYLRQFIPD